MAEEKMPAAEATMAHDDEKMSYEFAFHVLPTVAEGEVEGVFTSLKELITKNGGEIFDEEAPERFELAYEIVKHFEGKNRKYASAYFGWVRFNAESGKIVHLTEELEAHPELLRFFILKLTKTEEATPFRFHEALADEKQVTTVEESIVIPETATGANSSEDTSEVKTEDESDAGDVDEGAIDEALEKKDV